MISPALTDNQIRLYLNINEQTWPPKFETVISDINKDIFPKQWKEGMDRYGHTKLWNPAKPTNITRDALSPIRDIFKNVDPSRVVIFELDRDVITNLILTGKGIWKEETKWNERTPLNLTLNFPKIGKSCLRRLREYQNCWNITEVKVVFESVKLYAFRSGVSILELTLCLSSTSNDRDELLSGEAFVEAIPGLIRHSALVWKDNLEKEHTAFFSIADLAFSLLGYSKKPTKGANRMFTCSYFQLHQDANAEDNNRISILSSKHYTSDYKKLNANTQDISQYTPFETIIFTCSSEGVSVGVQLFNEPPEFLMNYKKNAFERAYAPICLLSWHEYSNLEKLSENISFWPDFEKNISGTLELYDRVSFSAIAARSAFSFPRVSRLSLHERWREEIDSQLRLPNLRREVSSELREMTDVIRRYRDEKAIIRFSWLEAIGGAGVAGFTVFSLFKDLLSPSFLGQVWVIRGIDSIKFSPPASISAVLGLIAFIGTGYFLSRRSGILNK